jgi:hypothetical protein
MPSMALSRPGFDCHICATVPFWQCCPHFAARKVRSLSQIARLNAKWLTTFALILISFSFRLVSDQSDYYNSAKEFADALVNAVIRLDTPVMGLSDADAVLWKLRRQVRPKATLVLDPWHSTLCASVRGLGAGTVSANHHVHPVRAGCEIHTSRPECRLLAQRRSS